MTGWPINEAQTKALQALFVLEETRGEAAMIAFLEQELQRRYVMRQMRDADKRVVAAEERAGLSERRLDKSVEALGFYADPENYVAPATSESPVQKDAGKTARHALAALTDDEDNGGES
jgi:hypothetical protein